MTICSLSTIKLFVGKEKKERENVRLQCRQCRGVPGLWNAKTAWIFYFIFTSVYSVEPSSDHDLIPKEARFILAFFESEVYLLFCSSLLRKLPLAMTNEWGGGPVGKGPRGRSGGGGSLHDSNQTPPMELNKTPHLASRFGGGGGIDRRLETISAG